LQQHLQAADLAVREFGGEIDKMIEDKIMIVFEHDEPSPEISGLAIKFADRVSSAMRKDTGRAIGIGVNTGTTVAGVMGAVNARLSRTVVGDPVNLAARLASLATQRPEGGVIASQQILAGLPDSFKADKLPISKVKGKTQAVEAYLLQKADDSAQIS
jgi:class 3 adenylate cyclase